MTHRLLRTAGLAFLLVGLICGLLKGANGLGTPNVHDFFGLAMIATGALWFIAAELARRK